MSAEESFVLPSKRKVQQDLPGAIEHFEKLRRLIAEVEREQLTPIFCWYHDRWMLDLISEVLIPDVAKMVVEYARAGCKSGLKPVLFGSEPPLNQITRQLLCNDHGLVPETQYIFFIGENRSGYNVAASPVITTLKDAILYSFGDSGHIRMRKNGQPFIDGSIREGKKTIDFSGPLSSADALDALFQDDPRLRRESLNTKFWEYRRYGNTAPL